MDLIDLVDGALKDLEHLRRRLEAIRGQLDTRVQEDGHDVGFKNLAGHLSEAGLRELRALVDAGVSDSEIARRLAITQAAVLRRRREYLARRLDRDRRADQQSGGPRGSKAASGFPRSIPLTNETAFETISHDLHGRPVKHRR